MQRVKFIRVWELEYEPNRGTRGQSHPRAEEVGKGTEKNTAWGMMALEVYCQLSLLDNLLWEHSWLTASSCLCTFGFTQDLLQARLPPGSRGDWVWWGYKVGHPSPRGTPLTGKFSSGTPYGLVEIFLWFVCSLRLFLPNPSFPSLTRVRTVWRLEDSPHHLPLTLCFLGVSPNRSLACVILIWLLLFWKSWTDTLAFAIVSGGPSDWKT